MLLTYQTPAYSYLKINTFKFAVQWNFNNFYILFSAYPK